MIASNGWTPKILDIGKQIGNLTLAEAAQLRDHLQDVYGIAAATGIIPEPIVKPNLVIDNVALEPIAFDVLLESVEPANRIAAIRQVRETTGLSLKEARDMVEGAPRIIKQGMDKAEAEQFKVALERSGAKIAIQPCQT